MNAAAEIRTFDAVIIPADLVRRWVETMESLNRILEAEGDTQRYVVDFLEGLELTLKANYENLIQERAREDERLKENILQFPDLKKAKQRRIQRLNTQSA